MDTPTVIKTDKKTLATVREPFASADAAYSAMKSFFADVTESRAKHGIHNVIVGALDLTEDGEEIAWQGTLGDSAKDLQLAAVIFGALRAAEEEKLENIISGKKI